MDEIYEFESNECRVASMQIKATGYDIVTGISKKEKNLGNNPDTLNQLTNINNNIVDLLDKLEKQLEQLDQLTTMTTKVTQEAPKEEPKEKEITPPKMEDENNLKLESTPPKDKKTNNVEIVIEKPKKVFQKTTKNGSKAIMVRQNQLKNLKNSRVEQEKLLETMGLFPISSEQNLTPIEINKELPEDIERQIEDLTVKANIYSNEGETAKAEELYNKIKELNKGY